MSLLTLKSSNPSFSFIIQKRPALTLEEKVAGEVEPTPMLIKLLREGTLFGFYSKNSNDTYVIHFRDGFDEISFKRSADEEFEYLNLTRYNSSMFMSLAIKEYFGHIENNKYKEFGRDVEGYEHELTVNMVHVAIPKYLDFFKKSFPDFQLEETVQSGNNFKLVIKTTKSLHLLINYVSLLSLFLIMINEDEYLYVENALVERYLRIMNTLDAPYYIRYLFKLRVLSKSTLFGKHREELEKHSKDAIFFKSGDTHTQRIDFITSNLKLKNEIVDVGCGEGRYIFKLASKIEDKFYHAIDIEQELLDEVKVKAERKNIDNILYYNTFDSFKEETKERNDAFDILCTEVIEHMPIDDVAVFIEKMISFGISKPGSNLIITTPNADFNKYYNLEGMRHHDHKWEYGKLDFQTSMMNILAKYDYNFSFAFAGIGDCVNGDHVTQGIVISF